MTLADTYDAEVVPISRGCGRRRGPSLALLGAVLQGQTQAEDITPPARLRTVLAFGRVGLAFPPSAPRWCAAWPRLPFVGGMSTFPPPPRCRRHGPPTARSDRPAGAVISGRALQPPQKWLGGWGLPACVTVNRDDYSCASTTGWEIGQVPLGMSPLNVGDLAPGALYL